jgi:hypothetical protein
MAARYCPRMYAVCGDYFWWRHGATWRSDRAAIFWLRKCNDKWQLKGNEDFGLRT